MRKIKKKKKKYLGDVWSVVLLVWLLGANKWCKELVLAGMLLGARDVVGGIDWCKEQKDNENISKDMEKAKEILPVMRSAAKSLVLSTWAPSAQRLQTQLQRLAWKYTAMTRSFLSRQRGCFPET